MGKPCSLCGTTTIFFIWPTSRIFDKSKYLTLFKNKSLEDNPVCLSCAHKFGLVKE